MGSSGNRLDSKVGYGWPTDNHVVRTPRAGVHTSK